MVDKTKNEIKLLNSLTQDESALKSKLKENLLLFFQNLKGKNNFGSTLVKTCNLILQKDASSCGVCLCMAANAICNDKFDEIQEQTTDYFRCYILWQITTN